MARYVKDKKGQYRAPRVEHVVLSERHFNLRLVIAAIFLVAGAVTLATTFAHLTGTSSGWQEISVQSSSDVNLSQDFTLYYNLGASGVSAGTENREIASLYTDACIHAYQVFSVDEEFDGLGNLAALNASPNEEIEVDPLLYSAFEQLEEADCRLLFLGPLRGTMENLASCETDSDAKQFDPACSEDIADFYSEVLAFANDPDAISLELLGSNTVRLQVSEEYLSYLEENGITRLLDFYTMRNAFVADYIADTLIEAGDTLGILVSHDGFTRVLDGGSCSTALCDRLDNTIYSVATVSIEGMTSLVQLRSFPLYDEDEYFYYVYEDGTVVTPWVDMSDGLCRSALPAVIGGSETEGCAEVLLRLLPLYTEEGTTVSDWQQLSEEGLYTLFCQDTEVYTNLPDASFSELYDRDGVTYTLH